MNTEQSLNLNSINNPNVMFPKVINDNVPSKICLDTTKVCKSSRNREYSLKLNHRSISFLVLLPRFIIFLFYFFISSNNELVFTPSGTEMKIRRQEIKLCKIYSAVPCSNSNEHTVSSNLERLTLQ